MRSSEIPRSVHYMLRGISVGRISHLEFACPKNYDFSLFRYVQANFWCHLAFIELSQLSFSEPYGDGSLVLTTDIHLLSWLRMGGAPPLRGLCIYVTCCTCCIHNFCQVSLLYCSNTENTVLCNIGFTPDKLGLSHNKVCASYRSVYSILSVS
jgi:hypothetical protein